MKRLPKLLATSALALGAITQSHASGLMLMEQGAAGLGMAYAGAAAAVWDASTVWWNPAGMSQIKGIQLVAGGAVIAPSNRFIDNGASRDALGAPAAVGPGDAGVSAFVPSLFATWQFADDWTAGISVNAPFGLTTEWAGGWVGRFFATRSSVKTYNVNPSIAWKPHERISIGGGINIQYIDGSFSNNALVPGPAVSMATARGYDWGFGWNVGALVDLYQGTYLGLTYRSTIDYTVRGHVNFPSFPAGNGPVRSSITLPDTFSVALSRNFTNNFRLAADWTWTGWSEIKNLTFVRSNNGALLSNETLNWDNSWRLGVGGEYRICKKWLVRAGFAYDKTPVPNATRAPRLPDADRYWFSVGGQYSLNDHLNVDLGYTFITTENVPSNLTLPLKGTLQGHYEGHVHLVALQVSYHIFEDKKPFIK